jgi:hypothetical protein
MSNVRRLVQPHLLIRRLPYEEPYHTQLDFTVSNGVLAAKIDIYCGIQEIAGIGKALAIFPKLIGDEYVYEYGSERPEEKFYRHFKLKAYTVGNVGNCAIQFTVNLNQTEPEEGICQFSLTASRGEINRLGELLLDFSKLEHLELQWSPKVSCLLESYSEDA